MALLAVGDATYPFFSPSTALMGVGCSKEAGSQAKALGATQVLLITDKVLVQIGLVQQIQSQLEAAGIKVTVFDGVEPNPTDRNVEAGAALYQQNKCDGLVSLGGGSAHDCAKGIGVVVTSGGNIRDYAGLGLLKKRLPPLMAINTTAGTGSETTRTAVITNTDTHVKMTIVDGRNTPAIAINDPKLMVGMPASLTASTGIDALSHAVEAYVSTMATPLTDALALEAIKLIGQYLRRAVANGADLQARDKMAYAEYMAGLAFSNGRLGCVHAMAHPLGAAYNATHGLCCAAVLAPVCEFNLIAVPERYAEITAALGENIAGLSIMDAAAKAPAAIRRLNQDIGMPATIAELGGKEADLERLAKESVGEIPVRTNPRTVNFEQMLGIYKAAMGAPLAKAAAR